MAVLLFTAATATNGDIVSSRSPFVQAIYHRIRCGFVLTIAHRMHPLVGCDRTLVLDRARQAEFDGLCASVPNSVYTAI